MVWGSMVVTCQSLLFTGLTWPFCHVNSQKGSHVDQVPVQSRLEPPGQQHPVVLLVLLWLGLPQAAPPSPLLGALMPIPLGVGVVPDWFFLFFCASA